MIKNPCKICHGTGKVATAKTLEVSIPVVSTTTRALHCAAWAMPVPTAAPPVM